MTEQTQDLELRVSRYLSATPEEVFDAYTDADKQKIWFSILDETPGIVEIEVDLRVGGQQTAVWGPDRENLFRETQTFLVIERPHRLITDSVGSSPDGAQMSTRVEVRFEARDEGTLMSVVQRGFPSVDMRDFFVEHAWSGAFDRIAAYLERESRSGSVAG
ncbi:hypothetical protein BH18ACT9_BH18ACT9_04350 [soil metagenome]